MENLQSCFCVVPSTQGSGLSHESLGTNKVPVPKVTITQDRFQVFQLLLYSLDFSTVF